MPSHDGVGLADFQTFDFLHQHRIEAGHSVLFKGELEIGTDDVAVVFNVVIDLTVFKSLKFTDHGKNVAPCGFLVCHRLLRSLVWPLLRAAAMYRGKPHALDNGYSIFTGFKIATAIHIGVVDVVIFDNQKSLLVVGIGKLFDVIPFDEFFGEAMLHPIYKNGGHVTNSPLTGDFSKHNQPELNDGSCATRILAHRAKADNGDRTAWYPPKMGRSY
jgi:hypothetical protein